MNIETTYRALVRPLTNMAYEYLDNLHDAQDAVADAIIELIESKDSIKNDNHAKAFLFIAVRHRCMDRIKQRKVRKTFSMAEVPDQPDRPKTETGIKDFFRYLTGRQRLIINHYLNGYAPNEIAGMVGVSYQRVRSCRQEGVNRLKKYKGYFI